jgi:HD-GYP domain-containing protein (c-di-GMP phosphodiesterase class II)
MSVIRIPKRQLRKGMYVESVECSHLMFDKRRFVLKSDADLEAIWAAAGEYVVVNTSRGYFAAGGSTEPAAGDDVRREKAAETISRSTKALKTSLLALAIGDAPDIGNFRPVARDMVEKMGESPAIVTELTRLKTKDEGTFMHSLAVGSLMSGIGQSLDMDAETLELLVIAGILHDFGKLLIPNTILNKPGALTPVERQIVRNHPELGFQRLSTYPEMPELVLDVCRSHHELLDGSGYPRGLAAHEISQVVRISTICDVYDALTSARPYKKGWSGDEAINWMFAQENRFDRKLLVRLSEVTNGNGRG